MGLKKSASTCQFYLTFCGDRMEFKDKNKPSISVIIPALNEEGNLADTVQEVFNALDNKIFGAYEILIFDDGSTDKTGEIADGLASKNENIKVIHNSVNRGFGYNYIEGVKLAKCDYVIMIAGDNELPGNSIKEVLRHAGEADIVIPYIKNKEVRSLFRRIISRTGMTLVNLLFCLRIRYYNGPVLHKSSIIKSVPLTTSSYAYQIEALVQLLKSGCSYFEVGINIRIREHGTTKIFRLKNLVGIIKTIIKLFWKVNFGYKVNL